MLLVAQTKIVCLGSHVTCYLSHIMCQVSLLRCLMSGVKCRVSPVTCHLSQTPTAQPFKIQILLPTHNAMIENFAQKCVEIDIKTCKLVQSHRPCLLLTPTLYTNGWLQRPPPPPPKKILQPEVSSPPGSSFSAHPGTQTDD